MAEAWTLIPGALTLDRLRRIHAGASRIELAREAWHAIDAAWRVVEAASRADAPTYGVNTGFGRLARVRIAPDDIVELQRRLLLSHAVGVGEALPAPVVRLILALKINALARGHSGVRRALIEALITLFNADVLPIVPAKGSVGASGDLAPLAHLSLILIGEGEALVEGRRVDGARALSACGLAPMALAAKEGLALINGTQVSTALALAGLFAIEAVFAAALCAGAMSVDAAQGSDVPFDPRLHALRGHRGQCDVAACLAALLVDSSIRRSHLTCERVQDPYSLRCQPQVMGAALDLIRFAAATIEREANAVSDNPIVLPDSGEIVSGGNFHAEPVAFAADQLALALSEIGALSERRTALLMDPAMSTLPAFLIAEPGLNSGLMIAQVTAAALVAENKALAHPASIDSLPTSANQEDHVSMATYAARRLAVMSENAASIIAIELMAACQGVDLRRPLATSQALSAVHARVRASCAFLDRDRSLAAEIERLSSDVLGGGFHAFSRATLHRA